MRTKNKGFTLVEIILTITLLSFVSVVILRLYMMANRHNLMAEEKTMASLIAANMLEDKRQHELNSHQIFYYDENWQVIKLKDDKAIRYILILLTSSANDKGLYEITAQVFRYNDNDKLNKTTSILSYSVTNCLDYTKACHSE